MRTEAPRLFEDTTYTQYALLLTQKPYFHGV